MIILGIDPGPEMSAAVWWDGAQITHAEYVDNEVLLTHISRAVLLAIEYPEGRGLKIPQSVLDTAFWAGRFVGEYTVELYYPREVRIHHCGISGSDRGSVNQAILDRYEIGTKAAPGPLCGLKGHGPGVIGHLWDALAVALMGWDKTQSNGCRTRINGDT